MIEKSYKVSFYSWIGFAALLLLNGCGSNATDPSALEKALNELQARYDELTNKQLVDSAKWAADDIENIGDWEYSVKDIPYSSPEQLETVLNGYGDERWEVFWIERTESGFLVILKKPAVSYLSKIPLSQIGRFVIGEPEAPE